MKNQNNPPNVEKKDEVYKLLALNSQPTEGWSETGVGDALSKTPRFLKFNTHTIQLSPIYDLPYNPELKERAKSLRKARNLPEVLFWKQVHKFKFHGIDFDRQRIIGNYIVDFYVKTLGLVVEINGSSHDNKQAYDAERTDYLKSFGLKVVAIPVKEIMQNMAGVLENLEGYIVDEYGVEDYSPIGNDA